MSVIAKVPIKASVSSVEGGKSKEVESLIGFLQDDVGIDDTRDVGIVFGGAEHSSHCLLE